MLTPEVSVSEPTGGYGRIVFPDCSVDTVTLDGSGGEDQALVESWSEVFGPGGSPVLVP